MQIEKKQKHCILKNVDSFNIKDILECGQCFRFRQQDEKKYLIVAFCKELIIYQKDDIIVFENTSLEEFHLIWKNYFDLETNYSYIKNNLVKNDNIMKEAINFGNGIRILKQDPFECLISFIISQNNRIPMIKSVIENISKMYGKKINQNYSFPSISELLEADEINLLKCKTGFRAKYILDAVKKINNNEINLYNTKELETNKIRQNFMTIKGVGPKVANCAILFSQNKYDSFPVDVWIKRVMEYFYFNQKDTSIKEIEQFAYNKFGRLSGYAQQYLFYYARQFKIGAK